MLDARIRPVQSRQNSRVKELRAAMQRPGGEWVALEGEHLMLEAQRSGITLETIFVMEGHEERLDRLLLGSEVEVLSLPEDVFASAVTTESPQPVAALVHAPHFELPAVLGDGTRPALVVIAAGLQDPGNLGTLIRSAEAFGATGIIFLPGTTHLWNAKALRASAGSAFRLPSVACDVAAMRAFLQSHGVRIFASVPPQNANQITPLETLCGPSAILVGNEGAGLSQELIAMADGCISIPHFGMTESLNAAVAGSVLLYEASRQRSVRQAKP